MFFIKNTMMYSTSFYAQEAYLKHNKNIKIYKK